MTLFAVARPDGDGLDGRPTTCPRPLQNPPRRMTALAGDAMLAADASSPCWLLAAALHCAAPATATAGRLDGTETETASSTAASKKDHVYGRAQHEPWQIAVSLPTLSDAKQVRQHPPRAGWREWGIGMQHRARQPESAVVVI
jgi:hypothetical protein